MFDSEETYERAVNANVLTRELVSKLYNTPDDKILTCMFVSDRPAFVYNTADISSVPLWLGK